VPGVSVGSLPPAMDFEISRQRHRAVWARRCYLLPASDAASGPAPLPTRLISCVPGKMMPPIGRCRYYYYYYVNVTLREA
jgi:hypothetical protein